MAEEANAQDLLAADTNARLKEIRAKVDAGTALSASERKFLQEHATEVPAASSSEDAMQPIWAKSQVELAQHLGCSRKTIKRYLSIEGEDAPPAPTSDGRYNVTLWKLWCQDHGHLKKAVESVLDRQKLEERGIALKNERLEMENAVSRGELMSVSEVSQVVIGMFSQIVSPLRGAKHTLGPLVVGLPVPEATKRIGRVIDEQLTVASQVPEWAKKKRAPAGVFWQRVSAELSDLPKKFSLGDGLSET